MITIWRQFHYPSKVLIGTLLLLLLCLATYSSNGTIRNSGHPGGGEEDGGSGLGGTGRTINSLEPGGSGFGGTGFRPYLGFNDAGSDATLVLVDQPTHLNQTPLAISATPIAIAASRAGTIAELPPQQVRISTTLKNPVTVVDEASLTRDSAAISIAESMQWQLDSQVLALNSVLATANAADKELRNLATDIDSEEDPPATSATAASAAENSSEISWSDLAAHLSHNPQNKASRENSDLAQSEPSTMQRPERVVRPALPPVQRIRPVQRAGVLPPRIRPLSL